VSNKQLSDAFHSLLLVDDATIHPHLTGEGGFPCSRCFEMVIRCLPNNCATEGPMLDVVISTNSPKVRRRGCGEDKCKEGVRKENFQSWRGKEGGRIKCRRFFSIIILPSMSV